MARDSPFLGPTAATERIVGWYHTGPKLRSGDVKINVVIRRFVPNPVSPPAPCRRWPLSLLLLLVAAALDLRPRAMCSRFSSSWTRTQSNWGCPSRPTCALRRSTTYVFLPAHAFPAHCPTTQPPLWGDVVTKLIYWQPRTRRTVRRPQRRLNTSPVRWVLKRRKR